MAGLEVVVRPVVFPNIRPAPARVLAPADNPEQGVGVLSGSGGRLIDLQHSWSVSWSKSKHKEEKRQFDVDRIYQKNDDGSINKQNFVDVERVKKMKLRGSGDGPAMMPDLKITYALPPEVDHIETIQTDVTRITDEVLPQ